MKARAKSALAAALPVALLVTDRLLKHYAWEAPSLGMGAFTSLTPAYGFFLNKGMLFSSFGPAAATIASILAFAGLSALAFYRAMKGPRLSTLPLLPSSLIALGGGSNVFDRLAHGGVIDYLLFARSAWNIADIMILAGLLILVMRRPKGGKTADE